MPVLDGPGVCFWEDGVGHFAFLCDAELDCIFLTDELLGNDFFRVNSNPRGSRIHTNQKDVLTFFCPSASLLAGLCDDFPASPYFFVGVSHYRANNRVIFPGGAGTCPGILHSKGILTDGFGNNAEVKFHFTLVPDPEDICRVSLLEVEGTPVD